MGVGARPSSHIARRAVRPSGLREPRTGDEASSPTRRRAPRRAGTRHLPDCVQQPRRVDGVFVPPAAVLWNGSISFGGDVSFISADLIIIPILFIYAKYYGKKMA